MLKALLCKLDISHTWHVEHAEGGSLYKLCLAVEKDDDERAGSMDNSDLIDSRSGRTVGSNNELTAGDRTEAYYKGILVHRGEVTDIAPNHELFWILGVLTGGRRLLDIRRVRDPQDGRCSIPSTCQLKQSPRWPPGGVRTRPSAPLIFRPAPSGAMVANPFRAHREWEFR